MMKKKALLILMIILMSAIVFLGGVGVMVMGELLDFSGRDGSESSTQIEEYKYAMPTSIITNIKDSRKYVKCKLVFKLDTFADQEEFENRSYIVNDIIIGVLRDFSEREYESYNIRQMITEALSEKLTETLDITGIRSIYFEELITQ